jgi:hypothetical protein
MSAGLQYANPEDVVISMEVIFLLIDLIPHLGSFLPMSLVSEGVGWG